MLSHFNGFNNLNESGLDVLKALGSKSLDISGDILKGIYNKPQQQLPAINYNPAPTQGTDWSKVLIYGGLAVGGVAAVMYMMKRRKR